MTLGVTADMATADVLRALQFAPITTATSGAKTPKPPPTSTTPSPWPTYCQKQQG